MILIWGLVSECWFRIFDFFLTSVKHFWWRFLRVYGQKQNISLRPSQHLHYWNETIHHCSLFCRSCQNALTLHKYQQQSAYIKGAPKFISKYSYLRLPLESANDQPCKIIVWILISNFDFDLGVHPKFFMIFALFDLYMILNTSIIFLDGLPVWNEHWLSPQFNKLAIHEVSNPRSRRLMSDEATSWAQWTVWNPCHKWRGSL